MDFPLTNENLESTISAALNELQCGCSTIGEIAERLRINSCSGFVSAIITPTYMSSYTMQCPVGKWIQNKVPWQVSKGFAFQVHPDKVVVGGARIQMPALISQFIKAFDENKYPDLRSGGYVMQYSTV